MSEEKDWLDMLVSLSPEELAKVPVPSDEERARVLAEAREARAAVEREVPQIVKYGPDHVCHATMSFLDEMYQDRESHLARITTLTADRDAWREKATETSARLQSELDRVQGYRDHVDKLEAERDEWKRRAEETGSHVWLHSSSPEDKTAAVVMQADRDAWKSRAEKAELALAWCQDSEAGFINISAREEARAERAEALIREGREYAKFVLDGSPNGAIDKGRLLHWLERTRTEPGEKP